MVKGKLEIHSENILPIIKKWLYSDKDIFVRELISNACDAIHKVKILRDQGKATAKDEEFKIDILIDKESRTLKFIDTGIGMDANEIKEYIAQIAFSGAEAFVEKYEMSDEKEQFIGHFGLGFYSSYMVAERVDIDSLSYRDGTEAAFWSCDGSSDYTLEAGKRETRGTEITLHVNEESDEYLEEHKLKGILKNYCSFLPCPIFLNGTQINDKEPLWIKSPSDCSKEEYLEFYRRLYPLQPDPLFWVHLNVDYPFNLKGILYFPKVQKQIDLKQSRIHLYCNRVFVSEDCKEIVPNYLMPLQGIIDSPDIPLNVSRSYLQMDKTVRQLSGHISKKVSDSLNTLYKTDRDHFIACWKDASIIIKLGAIEDDKFYSRVKDFLIWKTTDEEWLTAEEYLERYKELTHEKILYTTDAHHNVHIQELYSEKGIAILCAGEMIDSYMINTLEKHLPNASFQRIDGAIDESILDKEREKSILDSDGKTDSGKLADFFRRHLKQEQLEIEAKSLSTDSVPGYIVIDENQRRMQEYLKIMNQGGDTSDLLQKKTLVINTNSPLIEAIRQLEGKDPQLAEEMCEEVYGLALLSQREMDASKLNQFVKRTNQILEKLIRNSIER